VQQLTSQLAGKENDAPLRFEIGDRYLQLGKFYEAIAQLSEAVKIDGSNARYRCRLAEALTAAGRNNEALTELEAVFKANPASPDLELALGRFVSRGARLSSRDWLRLATMLETIADQNAKSSRYEIAGRAATAAFLAAQEAGDVPTRDRLEKKSAAYKSGRLP
jgi:tetratricopeptide (TPR) repeat protein